MLGYGAGDGAPARIEITHGGAIVRESYYPSYRIWNIAAHFGEIVDDLMSTPTSPVAGAPEPHEN